MSASIPLENDAIDPWLASPPTAVIEAVKNHHGDYAVLGVGGKMGTTTALMLVQALHAAGREAKVYGVSRFSRQEVRDQLDRQGITTVACDLAEPEQVEALPDAANVLYLAGQKFGTSGAPEDTWLQNTVVPGIVARRYREARTVAFSTGCVYPFADVTGAGCDESTPVAFLGDYASSCVGRERVFTHYAKRFQTPLTLYRLNYAVELRYGVLVDMATRLLQNEAIDLTTGWLNLIWQGDAVDRAIRCLDVATPRPTIMNVTGPEKLSVRDLATRLGERLGRTPRFTGEPAPTAWIADASASMAAFGPLQVGLEQMLDWTATYLTRGGRLLGKPTHFETRDGTF
jgi:nucleoside-diphosphate-sugar epimerase